MNRKRSGVVCMILGVVLIVSALFLVAYNKKEDSMAGHASDAVLSDIQAVIPKETLTVFQKPHVNPFDQEAVDESYEMTVTDIGGYGYIGYLSIPAIDLELPVMSEWDYPRLKIAPCRQFGSTKSDDLVIAGHNFRRHFKRISELKIGDLVQFTDMDGEVSYYLVDIVDVISPMSTSKVRDSQWDLILYTCTYGGRSRVMTGCCRVTEDMLQQLISSLS